MATTMLHWFVDCLISILALAGYVTYYNQLLHDALHQRRLRIDVMIVGVALGLQLAQVIDPLRFKVYANLQLLVLAFPLLGTDMNRRHLVVRFIALAGFTALNHPGLAWWQYGVALLGQGLIVAIMVRWHQQLREHFGANSAVMLLLVAGYWLPRTDLTIAARLGLIATYLVISGANFWYWLALRRADRRYSQLAHRVNFDPLTNAASYALFRRDAQRAFARARTHKTALILMMLDIDYFKRINDHYGHPVGDAVLVACLQRLEQVLKTFDARIYRTGGEEFTVILPGVTLADAEALAISCRKAMRAAPLAAGDLQIDVTLSIGLDAMTAADASIDELYARVDADLYRSKARGRDTITVDQNTLWRHDRLTVSHFFAEFTQPVVIAATKEPLAIRVAARYWSEKPKDWIVADATNMALVETLRFLTAVVPVLKPTAVEMELAPSVFADPTTLPRLRQWQAEHLEVKRLRLVLQGTPAPGMVAALAPHYQQAHCALLLHPLTAQEPWQACLPFVDALVVDLQADRKQVAQRAAAAQVASVPLYVRQVRDAAAFVQAKAYGAVVASGDFFGAPVLPQVAARTNHDQLVATE